jgi:hypothetical protein
MHHGKKKGEPTPKGDQRFVSVCLSSPEINPLFPAEPVPARFMIR